MSENIPKKSSVKKQLKDNLNEKVKKLQSKALSIEKMLRNCLFELQFDEDEITNRKQQVSEEELKKDSDDETIINGDINNENSIEIEFIPKKKGRPRKNKEN
jgi:hypothetical protein